MIGETFESARARNRAAGGAWFDDLPLGTWPVLQTVPYRDGADEVLPGGYMLACDEKMRYQGRPRPPWNIYRIDAAGRLHFVRGGWWRRLEAQAAVMALARSAAREGAS